MSDSQREKDPSTQRSMAESHGRVGLASSAGGAGGFDADLYGDGDATYGIEVTEEGDAGGGDDGIASRFTSGTQRKQFSGPGLAGGDDGPEEEGDVFDAYRSKSIAEREDAYHARRRERIISPARSDPFAAAEGGGESRSYKDVMEESSLQRERADVLRAAKEKMENGEASGSGTNSVPLGGASAAKPPAAKEGADGAKKRRRWDSGPDGDAAPAGDGARASRWDATPTPSRTGGITRKNRWDETPTAEDGAGAKTSRWDETPAGATPSGGKKSRWDETPVGMSSGGITADPGATPVGGMGAQTPIIHAGSSQEDVQKARWERELDDRNRPLSDAELDTLLPSAGYQVLEQPADYVPIMTPGRKLMQTPKSDEGGFHIQEEMVGAHGHLGAAAGIIDGDASMPELKQDDYQFFEHLLTTNEEDVEDAAELRKRRISKLLLKVKNGTPAQRKQALRQLTDRARDFGAGPLFDQILPLLMSPSLEDQERHLLVKVIDRVLYKLDDLVRPYVHKILVVIEPLLIDEDYYARVEGREVISNLAKAAGLATMIATMRPDIDNLDEYVRNTTARAFAVVASALGIPQLLPFLKAVCKSKKSWQARHTGVKIVQQIALLMGCAILPHLKHLVSIIEHGLTDEQQKVRTMTGLALSALAESASPYGIESFDTVLKPLWLGVRQHRGKGLAAFLKAIGFIIPLMDTEFSNYYTREVMPILIREFKSPDEEMKRIVLKVVKQCVATDGVEPQYVRDEILDEFFSNFWTRRMAHNVPGKNKQLVDTTAELAAKVGGAEIIQRIVNDLKDESEPYRKMVMEAIDMILSSLGAADLNERLEMLLIDGVMYAFQEQSDTDERVPTMLNGFGTVVNTLGTRTKPYLPQICGTIRWRLNNKSAKVRQQAADLISRIAVVMKACNEDQLMGHLGVVLFEFLGEEYPDVLGSILGGLKMICNVIGMNKMTPPIKDLLPRLAPILRNRHEKVQENCIDLVGRIADRGAEYVSAREWMRIAYELLEMLKAHKKAIRRATVNTFGYIAKAIGPQDVLATLLNNLKVQERQNRVCTTVAIAIVAETCSPFTVLPALMNEYRVPDVNVQNGVLKSFSFLFEYIGEMAKDYIFAITPLLEDALMDRDIVHRQTAATAVKHLALGVAGLGCEDCLVHLLNVVWPNIFEASPHVIGSVHDAIDGCRVALGPTVILQYLLQGLFHPARKVRDAYWRVYNNLYVGCQDSLVPAYPRLENDERNSYARDELLYTL